MVIGGGNFWRYRDFKHSGLDRVRLDHMGMMATVINGSAMKGVFEKNGIECHVMSALSTPKVAEDYDALVARKHLEENHIVNPNVVSMLRLRLVRVRSRAVNAAFCGP